MIKGTNKYFPGNKQSDSLPLYLGCALLMVTILLVDLAFPLGVAIDVLYIVVVLLSLQAPHKRFTIIVAVISSILTIVGFFFSPPGGALWKSLFNRAIGLFAIWVTTLLSLHRKMLEERTLLAVREREKALEDIRVLQGLLPICASCKKIRNDKGYWIQIESYIRDHSEAEFSHGICPECIEKLYPELNRRKNLKDKTDT
jgi:hypothetical protein